MNKYVISKEILVAEAKCDFPYPGASPKDGYLFKVTFPWPHKKKITVLWFSGENKNNSLGKQMTRISDLAESWSNFSRLKFPCQSKT